MRAVVANACCKRLGPPDRTGCSSHHDIIPSLDPQCPSSNPSPSRRVPFSYIYPPPSPPLQPLPHPSPPMLKMRPFLCIAASSLVISLSTIITHIRSHISPLVHPLYLQQARAQNPTASLGHHHRGPDPLGHHFSHPLCLSSFNLPLLICNLLFRPRPLHRIISSLSIPSSRILPRHHHQQAHKVVGRLGDL